MMVDTVWIVHLLPFIRNTREDGKTAKVILIYCKSHTPHLSLLNTALLLVNGMQYVIKTIRYSCANSVLLRNGMSYDEKPIGEKLGFSLGL